MTMLNDEIRKGRLQQDELQQQIKRLESTVVAKQREITDLEAKLNASAKARQTADSAQSSLKLRIETLTADLAARDRERQTDTSARQKLEKELDDLRKLMANKSSEDIKRQEADRSREAEMSRLREQVVTAQKALESQREQSQQLSNKLRVDFEGIMGSYRAADRDLKATKAALDGKEKELQSLQSKVERADGERRATEGDLKRVRDSLGEVEKRAKSVEAARDVSCLPGNHEG